MLKRLLTIILLFYSGFCYAAEQNVPPSSYPNIPFGPQITASSDLPQYVAYFFALGIYLAGTLATIFLVVGGIHLIMSAGKPEKRKEALSIIKGAIIGLILLASSVIILNTINPSLKTVDITETPKQLKGVFLEGSVNRTPAPSSVADLSKLANNYSKIHWPQTAQDLNGQNISNCDPDPDAAYIIYFYKNKSFKNLSKEVTLKCGDSANFEGALSYILIKQLPGVYFYNTFDCKATIGSNEIPPRAYTTSIKEGQGLLSSRTSRSLVVYSIKIVNSFGQNGGSFFGAITHQYKNFNGTFSHFPPPTNSGVNKIACYSAPNDFAILSLSFTIYQWIGSNAKKVSPSGAGVILYTQPNWTGGKFFINSFEDISRIENLSGLKVNYEGSGVPKKEKDLCPNFGTKGCLRSIKVDGNYLVLLSTQKDSFKQPISGSSERFPKMPNPDGPPDLWLEVTKGYAQWIEVIPLSRSPLL